MPAFLRLIDLNDDLILTCLRFLGDDIKNISAASLSCKRLHHLSSHHSVLAAAYDANQLSLAFGSKSRYSIPKLREYVSRYFNARKNLEGDSPEPTAYRFHPLNEVHPDNDHSHFLYGRFMFQVNGNGANASGSKPITVGCYDMDDSLRLLWESSGEWADWGTLMIRSCEFTHGKGPNNMGSEMTVLMQAGRRKYKLLNMRTFHFNPSNRPIKLREIQSKHFEAKGPKEYALFVHQGKWILSASTPPYLMNIETAENYPLRIPKGQDYHSCSFASRGLAITRSTGPASPDAKFGIFRIPSSIGEAEPIPDVRNQSLTCPRQSYGLQYLSGSDSPSDTAPNLSFLTWAGNNHVPRLAIMNILSPKNELSDRINLVSVNYPKRVLGSPSQYRTWVFGFAEDYHDQPTPSNEAPHLVVSRLQACSNGGLEFGPVGEVRLPDEVLDQLECTFLSNKNCVFDEFRGRLYIRTKKGLYVLDFA